MLNSRYFIDRTGRPIFNDEAYGNAWFVDGIDYVEGADAEMDRLDTLDPRRRAVADASFRSILGEPAAASPADTIRLTTYAPDRLTYAATTARGALAVFSEVYFPGDGTPPSTGSRSR